MTDLFDKKQLLALCEQPLYGQSRDVAGKLLELVQKLDPDKKISNGQMVMVAAIFAASCIGSTPNNETEEAAIAMHDMFLRMVLASMKDKPEVNSIH